MGANDRHYYFESKGLTGLSKMDSTLYNAAMRGNTGDANFLLADHLKRDEENGYQVTPKGNTVLHVAALYGHSHFAAEVLKITPALLCCQNKKNETTLHIAANEGHTEDPEFEFLPNHAQEMPLYLAAESGFHDALIKILESCKKPIYVAGPSNRTPLHEAVIQEHRGLTDVVSDMLAWKKSLVYLLAGCENDWTTAIHIAASEGYAYMINRLLNQCPDCWDMLNSNNQNALHVAVLNNQDNEKLMEDLCSIGRFEKRDFEVKRKYEYMPNPNDEMGTGVKMQLREDDHDKANKADQTKSKVL
ncbi:hypothetical protein P3S67_031526 [Capsicum chacoense]